MIKELVKGSGPAEDIDGFLDDVPTSDELDKKVQREIEIIEKRIASLNDKLDTIIPNVETHLKLYESKSVIRDNLLLHTENSKPLLMEQSLNIANDIAMLKANMTKLNEAIESINTAIEEAEIHLDGLKDN